MIHLIENSLTRKKNVLNFIDDSGTVLGFNPFPDGNPISWELTFGDGRKVSNDNGMLLQEFLQGFDRDFGPFMRSTTSVDAVPSNGLEPAFKREALEISFLNPKGDVTDEILRIEFSRSIGYYTASLSLSKEDTSALKKKSERHWKVLREDLLYQLDVAVESLKSSVRAFDGNSNILSAANDIRRILEEIGKQASLFPIDNHREL